jgi:hypothetical protein
MNAAAALQAARAAGVTIMVDREDLVLVAAAEPPSHVLEALSREKAAIIAFLRRDTAEPAFDERVAVWLNDNPAPSPPGQCAGCGRWETSEAVVVPFGTESGPHTWLHAECWPAWHRLRQSQARAALGIQMHSSPGVRP